MEQAQPAGGDKNEVQDETDKTLLFESLKINAVRTGRKKAPGQRLILVTLENLDIRESIESPAGNGVVQGEIPRGSPGDKTLTPGIVHIPMGKASHTVHPSRRRKCDHGEQGQGNQKNADKLVARLKGKSEEYRGKPEEAAAGIGQNDGENSTSKSQVEKPTVSASAFVASEEKEHGQGHIDSESK